MSLQCFVTLVCVYFTAVFFVLQINSPCTPSVPPSSYLPDRSAVANGVSGGGNSEQMVLYSRVAGAVAGVPAVSSSGVSGGTFYASPLRPLPADEATSVLNSLSSVLANSVASTPDGPPRQVNLCSVRAMKFQSYLRRSRVSLFCYINRKIYFSYLAHFI